MKISGLVWKIRIRVKVFGYGLKSLEPVHKFGSGSRIQIYFKSSDPVQKFGSCSKISDPVKKFQIRFGKFESSLKSSDQGNLFLVFFCLFYSILVINLGLLSRRKIHIQLKLGPGSQILDLVQNTQIWLNSFRVRFKILESRFVKFGFGLKSLDSVCKNSDLVIFFFFNNPLQFLQIYLILS